MRSEVKIGIICLFVLVLGLVAYFAWSGNGKDHPPVASAGTSGPSGEPGARVPPPSHGLGLSPSPSYGESMAMNTTTAPAGPTTTGPGLLSDDPRPTGLRDPAAATLPAPGPLATSLPSMSHVESTGPISPLSIVPPGMGTTPTSVSEYTVKKGDSVWTIAKQFKVSRAALMAANNLTADSILHEKQVLKIPASVATISPLPSTTLPALHSHGAAAASTHPAGGAGTSYTVKAGDSLRKIAKSVYGDEAKWKQIYVANKTSIGSDANDISAGMTLKIPQQ